LIDLFLVFILSLEVNGISEVSSFESIVEEDDDEDDDDDDD